MQHQFQRHWYLGFLGLVGFWMFPSFLEAFQYGQPWWDFLNALWFLWFLYFIPEAAPVETE
jgi:hypothetical protein